MKTTNRIDWTQTATATPHVEIRDGVETYYAALPDGVTADDAAVQFVATYSFSRLDNRGASEEEYEAAREELRRNMTVIEVA